jgi:hypothetical protein
MIPQNCLWEELILSNVCFANLPQNDDPIVTQFVPENGQWERNDDNIRPIDPKNGQIILHNYCKFINTTPSQVFVYLVETKSGSLIVEDNLYHTQIHYAFDYFNQNSCGDISQKETGK